MPVTHRWLITDRVLLLEFKGNIAMEDIRDINARAKEVLETTESSVYIIHDMLGIEKIPMNWTEMSRATKQLRNPKIAHVVNIRAESNVFITTLMSLFQRIFKLPSQSVTSMEDAVAFLIQLDPSLTELEQTK